MNVCLSSNLKYSNLTEFFSVDVWCSSLSRSRLVAARANNGIWKEIG